MSNLSDLLPAGAGAKSATFTADGTLATGTTVILQSDGTVSAVAETTQSASAGTATQITSNRPGFQSAVYDASSGKVVFVYIDELNSDYATAAVGTISGTSISFGTPVVVSSNTASELSTAYDSSAQKIIVVKKINANGYGYACVGTVSGTSISFGSVVNFTTSVIGQGTAVAYDVNNDKFVVFYSDQGDSDRGTAKVGTVTGTSITYGSANQFDTEFCNWFGATYDSSNGKVVVVHRGGGDIRSYVGTVSGTSISFGSVATVNSGQTGEFNAIGYDVQSGKVVVAYEDRGNSYYGTAKVGTVSGTSISFGSAVVFRTANTGNAYFVVGYDAGVGRTNIFFRIFSPSNQGLVATGTVSGTSITFDSNFTVSSDNRYVSAAYDSVAKKWGYGVRPGANDFDGLVFTTEGVITNLTATNFVGITDEAIANAATGSVVVEGGVITNSSLIDAYLTAGSETVFEAATSNYTNATFDSTNNKVVIVYSDAGNSNYGTAVVGTVSGTSITFGTPVVFANVYALYTSAAFDSNTGKVVIAYVDGNSTNDGVAIVGTVSGTSISFGSPTTFDTGAIGADTAISYDSTAQKVVIAYRANPNYGNAIVGTVSGTSISFGSSTVFESASTIDISMVYDPDQNKTIISYRDNGNSDYGTAIVGTVSGTSISFGTAVVYASAYSGYNAIAYDTNADKVVITYNDGGNSYYGTAIVGTVSGTSISFGTEVTFTSYRTDYNSIAYDAASGSAIISYKGTTPTEGFVIPGTVSGTSISFGTAVSYNPASTTYQRMVYDSNAEKSVVAYTDAGNSNYGTATVITSSQDLTVGSTYYVQDDGSLSTTSSSVTAGKALSSTTLLLKG